MYHIAPLLHFNAFRMAVFYVYYMFFMEKAGKGMGLLKTVPFLTSKLQPLSKLGASRGSYLQDSFRTTQLIPSLQRIKNLAFATSGELGTLKIIVVSGFLVLFSIMILMGLSQIFKRAKMNKVHLQLSQK